MVKEKCKISIIWTVLLAVAPAISNPAAAQQAYQPSGNPTTTYGAACGQTVTSTRTKADLVQEALSAGDTMADVSSIVVLQCRPNFGTQQRATRVDCPAYSQFSYCVSTSNDGAGIADILLGVVKTNADNGPNGPACGGGRRNFEAG